MELYETKLSEAYWGSHLFPEVVFDILEKSVKKDVYLIGLVEVHGGSSAGGIYSARASRHGRNILRIPC